MTEAISNPTEERLEQLIATWLAGPDDNLDELSSLLMNALDESYLRLRRNRDLADGAYAAQSPTDHWMVSGLVIPRRPRSSADHVLGYAQS